MESQKKFSPAFSFELFPPQTPQGIEKLKLTRRELAQFNPKFFSVTFGAGGSTRERTLDTVLEIQAEGHVVAPHLSCIGSTQQNIREIVEKYYHAGIRHIVALRGDLPSGMAQAGEFRYASELVNYIRQEFGDAFHIEVAAYPEYQYFVGEKAASYEGNPWVLYIFTPAGGINFDSFMYFPRQNYPDHGYGGSLERVADWVYVHE